MTNKNLITSNQLSCALNSHAAASVALAAGFVAQDLPHVDLQGVGLADPVGPLEQRSLALEHLQALILAQVAVGNQIQPTFKRKIEMLVYNHKAMLFHLSFYKSSPM
jgi:hypothetical protein